MAEIATPIFGDKSHISIDQRPGFIRTWNASNADRSKVRSAIERVFAPQKHRMGLFIRTIGIERAKANIAFNFKRFLYWKARPSAA